MKWQGFIFSLFLSWPCLALSLSPYAETLHQWRGTDENETARKDQLDPVIYTEENGAQPVNGIQADSLGENGQVSLNSNAEKEEVLHELDDNGGGSVFNHDARVSSKAKDNNDMGQYESEKINLVGNSKNNNATTKPVGVPSLTKEGEIDTSVSASNSTHGNDALKIIKSDKLDKNTDSTKTNNSQIDSSQPNVTALNPKNSEHRSLNAQNTKDRLFASELESSNVFDLPDVDIPQDDELLPKSSKLLLGESDEISSEKLRKNGERFTMFDHDFKFKKKQSVARKSAKKLETHSGMTGTAVNVQGGQIVGGQISGGNIFGGEIVGGYISGGTIKGGAVKGGHMSGGLMDGGLLLDGDISGGFLHNGTVKGGLVRGGNITGGVVSGGEILGGHVSSGFVQGGVLKKGAVEGGMLKGGIIDGGVLKGGVMESGKLLGGTVWNGRVTGGTILGGDVLGGEVGEGVVIRGGKINGTITVGRKMQSGTPFKGLFSAHRLASLNNRPIPNIQLSPQNLPISPNELEHRVVSSNHLVRPHYSSNSEVIAGEVGGRVNERPLIAQGVPSSPSNGVSSRNTQNDAIVLNNNKTPNVVVLSNISRARDEMKRTFMQTDGLYNRQTTYTNFASSSIPASSYGYPATSTTAQFPSSYSSPQSGRQSEGININQFVKQVSNSARGVQRSRTENENSDIKPNYHWILNQIRNGEVVGTPPERKFVAKGGIRLNRASIGFDGTATFMDGGSYAGTCVSDPSLCPRGLSIEMTIKVDPAATMYRAPRYLLDSGASSFDSRGVALYTMDNELRADVAIKDKSYCLVVPLVTDKWQDVVLTYHKNGELNMYINCKFVAATENDDHCINCHTPGCHNSDVNTKLVLGRANGEPESNFARFKAGDLSIYERYLTSHDIDKICGFTKSQKPSPPTGNYMTAMRPSWRSPVVNSYPDYQSGFLKSAISDPQNSAVNVQTSQKKTETAINFPYFTAWGGWTMCSTSCGLGTRTRQRSCIYAHAQSGWQTCHGVTFQAKRCSTKCPGARQPFATETATRKDSLPASEGKHPASQLASNVKHPSNAGSRSKSVYETTKDSTGLKEKENTGDGKLQNKIYKTKKDVKGTRRNKITRILSKLDVIKWIPSK